MSEVLRLKCRCGAVRGIAKDLSPRTGNHAICYCRDCQAFARFLGSEGLLDPAGGSEIFQLTPSQLTLETGQEHLRCIRLSGKGLLRWYVDCCRTPVANTLATARAPFAGMLVAFVDGAEGVATRDRALGPVIARTFGRDATGPVPNGTHAATPLALIPRMLFLLARWFIGGKAQPSPFFAPGAKEPRVQPRVLSPDERAALGPV